MSSTRKWYIISTMEKEMNRLALQIKLKIIKQILNNNKIKYSCIAIRILQIWISFISQMILENNTIILKSN
jgi:hypothetical protein